MAGSERGGIHPMLYLLIGILGVLTFLIVAPLWSFILGGLFLGYLGTPIFRWVKGYVERRDVAAAASLLLLAVIILAPTGYLGYQLVLETQSIAQGVSTADAQRWLEAGANITREYTGWPEVTGDETPGQALVDEVVPRLRAAVLNWLPNAASFLAEFALGVTVVFFIGYYALRDGDRLVRFVEDFLPLTPATEQRIIDEVQNSLDAVVFGQLLTALGQGVLAGLGFWLFGVPAPVLLGFLSAVLSLLPIVGPPLVWLPAGVFLIVQGHTARGIGLLVWGAILVSTLDNVVKPKLMSERSGMHPTVALLGVLGGLIAFGFMGFLLGPVVLASFLMLVRIYMEQRPEPAPPTLEVGELLDELAERGVLGPEPPADTVPDATEPPPSDAEGDPDA